MPIDSVEMPIEVVDMPLKKMFNFDIYFRKQVEIFMAPGPHKKFSLVGVEQAIYIA